jgi:cardiolipin synthase (CMP-forming)
MARALLRLPNLLSLARIPLAVAIWISPSSKRYLAGLMAAAGVTDILDGWTARAARRSGRIEDDAGLGAWLDPLCDKAFVTSLGAAIYATRKPPMRLIAPAFTREWLQAVLLAWRALSPRLRVMPLDYHARKLGKATTIAQFMTLSAVAIEHRSARALSVMASVLGALAVLDYGIVALRLAEAVRRVESAS